MLFFLLFAGFFSGITTVLFGFGGGFFTVPIVAYTLSHCSTCGGQQPMTVAVATSALVMLVTSLLAVLRRQRPDSRSLPGIGSLTLAIAVGAVPGAIAAQAAGSTVIRDGFVLYLGGTLMDCLLRPGFLRVTSVTPKMKGWPAWVGGIIGLLAAFLGVGGSVMTVPLLRRRGASMTQAAAVANLLTLPMALMATLTYLYPVLSAALSGNSVPQSPVDWQAGIMLIIGARIGMWGAGRFAAWLPDRLHAACYPWLLGLSMVAILCVPIRG